MKAVTRQGDINYQSRQVAELKNELHGSAISVESQVKKLKQEQKYKWKYASNKIKFYFNSEILVDLNQVIWPIEITKSDYAQETVREIADKVKKRNKLIQIADSGEGVWDTVKNSTSPVQSPAILMMKTELTKLRIERSVRAIKKNTKKRKRNLIIIQTLLSFLILQQICNSSHSVNPQWRYRAAIHFIMTLHLFYLQILG